MIATRSSVTPVSSKSVWVAPDQRDPNAVLTRLFVHLHAFTVNELQGDDMTALVPRYRGPVS